MCTAAHHRGDRARNLGLGPYPAVSLAQARQIALDSLQTVREGRDPIAEKQAAKEAARNPVPSTPTFAEAAAQVIELRRPTWGNPKHGAQWSSTLETYACPVIGGKPVDATTASDVLSVLTPVWAAKPETASRVRQRMETVMDWVVTNGWRLDNPAGKSLLKVLPSTRKPEGTPPGFELSESAGRTWKGPAVHSLPVDKAGVSAVGALRFSVRRNPVCQLERD